MKSRVSKSKCEISLTGIITPINLSHLSTSGLAGPPLSLSICLALYGTCVRVQRMEGEKDEGKSQRRVSKLLVFFFSPTAGQRQPGQEAPSCPSTICRAPGAARIYPHRACEQQPPHPPSIQHPAPSRRRKQPVRGDLRFFREAGTSVLYSSNTATHTSKQTPYLETPPRWMSPVGGGQVTSVIFAPTSEPGERTAYLDMCVGLRHPEARIDGEHMVSVSWRPQAALLLPALKTHGDLVECQTSMWSLKIDPLRQQQHRVSYLRDPYQRQDPNKAPSRRFTPATRTNVEGPDCGHTLARHLISDIHHILTRGDSL